MKRELRQIHPYFFVPSLDPEDQDRRLREFVSYDAPGADHPVVVDGEGGNADDELL
jgi:hypothetical protein